MAGASFEAARMESAREQLVALALALGFDDARWVEVRPAPVEVERLRAWLTDGRAAGLEYMARGVERRADPGLSLAGALSALVLGASHAHPEPPIPEGGLRVGRVARYAWSRDYHLALQEPLLALVDLARTLRVGARAYTDHGPVLERGLAARAGLGWRSRSSQIVSQKLGGFVTLAVVLADLTAPPTAPEHPDRCGRCTTCVTACPTAAIGPDRSVDARLCLSYWTIEHRGPIPWSIRPLLGDHLFGCDDCVACCPWTVRAGSLSSLLRPEPELAHPDLGAFFGTSNRAFGRSFAGTAFERPGRKGMARNAALVIGNFGRSDGLPLLEAGLADDAYTVREASAWAVGRLEALGLTAAERLAATVEQSGGELALALQAGRGRQPKP